MGRYVDDDDDVVVVERESGGLGLGAFVAGLALGAAAALLFAPASGEETRAKIRREARRARRRATEFTEDLGEELVDRAERVRTTVEQRVQSARDAVTRRARDVGDAVDAGRSAAGRAREELDLAVAETKRAYTESRQARRDARAGAATADTRKLSDGFNGPSDEG